VPLTVITATIAAAHHDVVDDFAGLIVLSATPRKLAHPGILHPGGRRRTACSLEFAAKNRSCEINDGGGLFDPGSRGEM
jgi:hypothetical protein